MNSSIKFIFNLLKKLKLPLIGYIVIVTVMALFSLVAKSFSLSPLFFTSLLLFSSAVFPFLILVFATTHLFSFQTDQSYNIFLSTLPITRKKQLQLSFITLFLLTALFSIVVFFASLFFNSLEEAYSHSFSTIFPLNEIFNMNIIYFLTLSLFTSIIIFLKILLIHNRHFFVALFFVLLSIIISTTTTTPALPQPFSPYAIFPIPFNLLFINQSLPFPQVGILKVIFFLLATLIFTIFSYTLYEYAYRTHKLIKIQKSATIITYSLVLTPILYTIYQSTEIIFVLTALIFIIICSAIVLKLTFKKFSFLTLLVPFVISNAISIPLTLATPHIAEQQILNEWNNTNFSSRNKINLYLPNINIYNKQRNLEIKFDSIPQQKQIFTELSQSAILKTNSQNESNPSLHYLVLKDNNAGNKSFIIQWKSETAKEQFINSIENLITSIEKMPEDMGNHFTTSTIVNYNSDKICFISNELKPICERDDKPYLSQPSMKQFIEASDALQSVTAHKFEVHSEFSSSLFNVKNFPNANVRILISN